LLEDDHVVEDQLIARALQRRFELIANARKRSKLVRCGCGLLERKNWRPYIRQLVRRRHVEHDVRLRCDVEHLLCPFEGLDVALLERSPVDQLARADNDVVKARGHYGHDGHVARISWLG
jgi:hypothetical protein